ncbi:MAG: ribonuclease J [Chloroflexota bacterium]
MASRQQKNLRIIPLGGLGEIGKNMTVIEYGRNLIVIDAGVMFPSNDMPGVDFILPDYNYLIERQNMIRGIVLTHGHLDHIGGLQFLMQQISVPIYGTPFTLGLLEGKFHEMGIKGDLRPLSEKQPLTLGSFTINAFHVTHSIPDCVGLVIETPLGKIVHTGDYKLDPTPVDGRPTDFKRLAELTEDGVLVLLSDSTNADRPGRTASDKIVGQALEPLFWSAPGRIIVATFASHIARIQQVIAAANACGRQVALAGRSLNENVALAQRLNYVKSGLGLIPLDMAMNLPENKLVIIATGTQGEPTSALSRMAAGNHQLVSIQPGDTVLVSGRVIPGKEESMARVINQLFARGALVIYGSMATIHTSGHGAQEDMRTMLETVQPKYFMPVHGEIRHLHLHSRLAGEVGIPEDRRFILENYRVWEFDGKQVRTTETIAGQDIRIDGRLLGDVNETVLRDRERLSTDGFVVAVLPVNKMGHLVGRPQLISRGFVHLRDSETLLAAASHEIQRLMRQKGKPTHDAIREGLGDFFYKETNRRPVVLPSIVKVV